MSLLIETISCIDGKLQNLFWHSARVNRSRKILFECHDKLSFDSIQLPSFVNTGKWKCRVIYDERIHGISFEPYVVREVKKLKLIESNINYSHKYQDRDALDELFKKREEADEIIIIKNGLVTDTSIANILLYDGNSWITPDTPLLEGTMRAELISKKVVHAKKIKETELGNYKKLMLVNAMNPFADERALNVSNSIVF